MAEIDHLEATLGDKQKHAMKSLFGTITDNRVAVKRPKQTSPLCFSHKESEYAISLIKLMTIAAGVRGVLEISMADQ